MAPYFQAADVVLYHGDCRDILPQFEVTADCVIADPPYGETSLTWDRWPNGWLDIVSEATRSLWCFGSMRMFLDRRNEFAAWKLSQDIIGTDEDGEPIYADVHAVWQKHTGSSPAADRFKRVHEHALHWYSGPWSGIHHTPPRVSAPADKVKRNGIAARHPRGVHHGNYGTVKSWREAGTRIVQSVIPMRSMHRLGTHPTEKPVELLDLLLQYACPPGGLVLDPFAGSGSTAAAARLSGRRAVLIEADERYCEAIALMLAQDVLPVEVLT